MLSRGARPALRKALERKLSRTRPGFQLWRRSKHLPDQIELIARRVHKALRKEDLEGVEVLDIFVIERKRFASSEGVHQLVNVQRDGMT
jgi:hypothetical protein